MLGYKSCLYSRYLRTWLIKNLFFKWKIDSSWKSSWYQFGTEPELSEFEISSSTPWPSHPQACCQFYVRLLHEQTGFAHFIHGASHLYFKTPFKFHKMRETKNGGTAFRSRSQSKQRSRLSLETYQETSLSTRARSNWFGLHPTVIAVFSRVQTNPTKGETAPGFKVTDLKKSRCRIEEKLKHTSTKEKRGNRRRAEKKRCYTFPNWFSVFQNGF